MMAFTYDIKISKVPLIKKTKKKNGDFNGKCEKTPRHFMLLEAMFRKKYFYPRKMPEESRIFLLWRICGDYGCVKNDC